MGEYAAFVWPSYTAVVVVLAALCFVSWNGKKNDEKKLNALQNQFDEMQKQDE